MVNRPPVTVTDSTNFPAFPRILSAPSQTRTDTERILSPLPLPIGLWGPVNGSTPPSDAARGGVEPVDGRSRQRLALLEAGALPVASWKFSRGSRACRIGAVSRPNTALRTYSENTRTLRSTVGMA